jgi:hypothetical protein
MDDESPLHDSPLEFMQAAANTGGRHDGQSILPEDGHYVCRCSCGEWHVTAPTQAEGLDLARAHTA